MFHGVLVLVLLVACAHDRFAGLEMGPRSTKLHERILTKQLANGLRVVLVPDARTNLVVVGVHYDVGGANDPVEDSGLAHYVEHVLFDVAYRGEGAALRDAALDENAMTSTERTYFFAQALDVELDRVLEAAARRLEARCEDFEDAALARERDVVVEEAKQRRGSDSVMQAIWGAGHPYAHNTGGTGFVDIERPRLCEFIDRHYGPSSAVLVVTGNVRDEHWTKIRQRFERIPKRARAPRIALPSFSRDTARMTVRGLENPTVMLVFPFEGDVDVAASLVGNVRWQRPDGESAWVAVLGERRAGALVVMGDVVDAKRLGYVEEMLREMVQRPIPQFVQARDRARIAALTSLDSIFGTGVDLAIAAADQQPVTRFRTIQMLDRLDERTARRWFDLSKAKTVVLLPEVGVEGTHRISSLTTSLHQLDVVRTLPGALPPVRPRPLPAVDYRLANGLRVLLSSDDDSLGFEARLVIETNNNDKLAHRAARFLEPDRGRTLDLDERKMVSWYNAMGVRVWPSVDERATTFRISSLSTFADWHVWNLAWTVFEGDYPKWLDRPSRRAPATTKRTAPSAFAMMFSRLKGEPDRSEPFAVSTAELEQFRRSAYRPELATLIVAGKFDPSAMRREIEKLFGGWRGGPNVPPLPSTPMTPRIRSFVAIPDAKSATVDLAIGFAAKGHERMARAVLEAILEDRLRVIREGLGISYGVHADVSSDAVLIVGSVEPAFAKDAATALTTELMRIRDGGADLEIDFARARRRVLVRALARPIGPGVRADALQRIAIDGRPVSDLDRDLAEIRALDFAAFRAIATRVLRVDLMLAAVRGEESLLEPVLRALGAPAIERWSN